MDRVYLCIHVCKVYLKVSFCVFFVYCREKLTEPLSLPESLASPELSEEVDSLEELELPLNPANLEEKS